MFILSCSLKQFSSVSIICLYCHALYLNSSVMSALYVYIVILSKTVQLCQHYMFILSCSLCKTVQLCQHYMFILSCSLKQFSYVSIICLYCHALYLNSSVMSALYVYIVILSKTVQLCQHYMFILSCSLFKQFSYVSIICLYCHTL